MAKKKQSKYESHILPHWEEIRSWAGNGCTDSQIYTALGIGKTTWFEGKKAHPELSQMLEQARKECINRVVNALYEMAVGRFVEVEKAFKCKEVYYDEQGRRCERERVEMALVKEYYPPQMAAAAFFLKNRDKETGWADNPDQVHLNREKFEHQKKMDEELI